MIDLRKFPADRARVFSICSVILLSSQNGIALAADQSASPSAAPAGNGNKQIAAISIPKDASTKDTGTASGGTATAPPPTAAAAAAVTAPAATAAAATAAAATAAAATAAAATTPAAISATPTPAAPTTPTTPATAASTLGAPSALPADADAKKMMLKPGQVLVVPSLVTEDLQPTDDALLAAEQTAAYPDSPEAHFIYAVALTRTSHVEDALKEVRAARRLAMAKGGYAYFDKMIQNYEELLASVPDDNRIRYGLAWAYYMKAYLLSQDSKKAGDIIAPIAPAPAQVQGFTAKAETKKIDAGAAVGLLAQFSPQLATQAALFQGKVNATQMPHLQSPKEKAAPFAVAEINKYYDLAIKHLDDLLVRKPEDVWAAAYRWHLYAEHTGDMDSSLNHWQELSKRFPNNPLLYLFLAEGWLKKGNLKKSLENASHAIMLRGMGN